MNAPGWRFAVALAAIGFVGPLSIHLFLPVMPEVKRVFATSSAVVGAAFSITLFVMAIATLAYGTLSDRYGRRPVLLAGLMLFTVGGVLTATAGSVAWLMVGRVVQALGAGSGAALSRAIAFDAYGAEKLVKVLAYLTMSYTIAPMLAPFIGGLLIDQFGWRSVFGFAVASGIAITALVWTSLYETHPPQAAPASALTMLRGFGTLIAIPRFTAFVVQTGASTAAFMAMATASSFLMQDYLQRPATEFGLYFMLFPVGFFLGTVIASRLSRRVPIETMVLVGSLLTATAVTVQASLILTGHLSPLAIFLPGAFLTFAQGLALPNAQSGAMQVVPKLAGTAAGLGVFFQMFLGAVGAQLYAILADGTPIPMLIAVGSATVLMVIAGATPYILKRRAQHA